MRISSVRSRPFGLTRFVTREGVSAGLRPDLRVGVLLMSAFVALAGCRSVGTTADAKPDAVGPKGAVAAARLGTDPGGVGAGTPLMARGKNELAAFAGGCFWGVEDGFRQVPGVVATAVGYTGGRTDRPTYEQVCSHTTGHAETVLVEFDPAKVSYEELLRVFFSIHDPTTMNRQGPDVGDQYRSAVFTFSDAQDKAVHDVVGRESDKRNKRVVTQVSKIGAFWKAEEYHQQYDEKTGTHSCPMPVRAPQGT
jgi:peptide-methionine (S)-S-oxide reductase